MNKGLKIILFIALFVYVVSPVDIAPGPVDDMIMILVYAMASRRDWGSNNLLKENSERRDQEKSEAEVSDMRG